MAKSRATWTQLVVIEQLSDNFESYGKKAGQGFPVKWSLGLSSFPRAGDALLLHRFTPSCAAE